MNPAINTSTQSAFNAIASGDMGRFMMAMTRGVDLRTRDDSGRTLLLAACEHHDDRHGFVQHLLESGANALAMGSMGQTALHSVCRKRVLNLDTVEMLLDCDIALNARDHDGQTALHALAERGWSEGCMALLEASPRPADLIDQVDNRGRTPLWHASNHAPLVCLLVSYGADPRILDHQAEGPMQMVTDSDARMMMIARAGVLNATEVAQLQSVNTPDDELMAIMQHSKAVLARDFIGKALATSPDAKSAAPSMPPANSSGSTEGSVGFASSLDSASAPDSANLRTPRP